MNQFLIFLRKNLQVFLFITASILIIPAFLINLGLMPLRFDGALRGIVSLEMLLSGDYITPTINGELYFNKPPLFNWFILAVFKIFGTQNEYLVRIPVILSILLIGITIFLFLRKRYDNQFALLNAFFFLTGGCVFFGYSSVGLVDFTMAWFLILSFYAIYHFYENGKPLLLFVVSYGFAALAFMIKGIPAIAFQAVTLTVFFVISKRFKMLFSFYHLAGILAFLLLVGSYYLVYFYQNPGVSFDNVFLTLFTQTTQKAGVPVSGGLSKFFVHFITFPLRVLYNLLPWALLLVFVFNRKFLSFIHSDKLLKFTFWALVFNILFYWLSVGTNKNMKYLIMFFPMIYFVLLSFYQEYKNKDLVKTKVLEMLFFAFSFALMIGLMLAPFYEKTRDIPYIWFISIGLIAVTASFTILYSRLKSQRLLVFINILIVARIAFNLILQPVYVESLKEVKMKNDAIEVGKLIKNEEAYLCTYVTEDIMFYVTREREEILPVYHNNMYRKNTFFIFDHEQLQKLQKKDAVYKVFYTFPCGYKNKTLYLLKLEQPMLINDFCYFADREP